MRGDIINMKKGVAEPFFSAEFTKFIKNRKNLLLIILALFGCFLVVY